MQSDTTIECVGSYESEAVEDARSIEHGPRLRIECSRGGAMRGGVEMPYLKALAREGGQCPSR